MADRGDEIVADVVEVAENANAYMPLGPRDERIFNDRYVLWMGAGEDPHENVAQRFRLRPDELDTARAEIHAALRAKGRTACTWEVGTHATPADLVERLQALGLVDDEPDAVAIGMVLVEQPALDPPADVEVRVARTDEERLAAARIAAVAFGGPELTEPLPTEAPPPRGENNRVYLAYVDGVPVARASASFAARGVTLFGGATLPEARGRGAYRALVAARWHDAVERGTPVLITQAGAMSRATLTRVGFREVCEIRILVDRF